MGEWRNRGEPCPLPSVPSATAEECYSCAYFRGSSYGPGAGARYLCNWPRNGSYVDPRSADWGDGQPREIPDAFKEAFR